MKIIRIKCKCEHCCHPSYCEIESTAAAVATAKLWQSQIIRAFHTNFLFLCVFILGIVFFSNDDLNLILCEASLFKCVFGPKSTHWFAQSSDMIAFKRKKQTQKTVRFGT